jgi:hypothetical protein
LLYLSLLAAEEERILSGLIVSARAAGYHTPKLFHKEDIMDFIGFLTIFLIMAAVNAFGYFGFLRGMKGTSKTLWLKLSIVQTVIFPFLFLL